MSDIHVDNVGTGYNQLPTKKSCEFAVRTLSLMEKLTMIDAAAMLGDYTASGHSYSIDHIKADFEYVRDTFGNLGDFPVAWIRGNHEINYYADAERPTTNDELYEYIDSNSRGLTVDPANPKGGYGYIDFPDNKIRMIFLNTSDVYTEYSTLSYRYDGNNVDIDTEQAYLADNQIKYYTLLDSMTHEFNRLKTVLNQ